MGARSKRSEKKNLSSTSTIEKGPDNNKYVIVRVLSDDTVHMMTQNAISSKKKSAKLAVGDVVSFEKDGETNDGMILLIGRLVWRFSHWFRVSFSLGKYDECLTTLEIVRRSKPTTDAGVKSKSTISSSKELSSKESNTVATAHNNYDSSPDECQSEDDETNEKEGAHDTQQIGTKDGSPSATNSVAPPALTSIQNRSDDVVSTGLIFSSSDSDDYWAFFF